MRFAAVPLAVVTDTALSPTDVRVYAALAVFANRWGEAFPAQRTIAETARVDRRTVRRSLAHLATHNHVVVDRPGTGSARTHYVLVADTRGRTSPPTTDTNGRTSTPTTGPDDVRGRTSTPTTGDVDDGPDSWAQSCTLLGALVPRSGRTSPPLTPTNTIEHTGEPPPNAAARLADHDAHHHACGHPLTDPPGATAPDGRTYCAACAPLTRR